MIPGALRRHKRGTARSETETETKTETREPGTADVTVDDPLRFDPIWRRYLWGGRRLETLLGKQLPPGDDYAESWEVVDHGVDQSRVMAGPLRGRTLGEMVRAHGDELLGGAAPHAGFPLLVKFLDVHVRTSLQVHPDDVRASRLDPPDAGKTEAWFVLHAEPHSRIYAGLRPGVDRAQLAAAIARGDADRCLHRFAPRVGDCVLIPAGTVHALGDGLVVAEVQQSSDATFRLFDWNRLGRDGRPRTLHVQAGLAVTDFHAPPPHPVTPQPTGVPHVQRLIACDQFSIDRWTIAAGTRIGGDGRCHVILPVSGQVALEGDAVAEPLRPGRTALLPAAAPARAVVAIGTAVFLDICPTP